MKKQKGITLIALVITIIVMLILVGVTVTVSLNGGLFTTAKEATGETQIAKEKEQLLMATLGALNENGKVDFTKLDATLPEGFDGSNGNYTSSTGNKLTVNENGSITLAGDDEKELTTLIAKTWNGLADIWGHNVWTDGTNIYYSRSVADLNNFDPNGLPSTKYETYVLNGNTWEPKTFNGFTNIIGSEVWTDGINTYYSNGSNHYVLNGETWEQKTWSGFTNIIGSKVWTDGINTYYSNGSNHYVLNGNTWEQKTWSGFTNIIGSNVWTDGVNIYYTGGMADYYVLNGDTWEPKTWNGQKNALSGYYVWTDGTNTYYSYNSEQYILNGDTWEQKTWAGLAEFRGDYIWTDGIYYYYSYGSIQYQFS